MVNGATYDFESITIMLPSGHVSTVENIKYDWKRDVDVLTDKSGTPRGTVRKSGEGECELDMSLFQFEILNKEASVTGILGMPPIPITVSMVRVGAPPIVDVLEMKITEAPREWKKGEELRMTIKGKLTAIPLYNGVPAYIPGV